MARSTIAASSMLLSGLLVAAPLSASGTTLMLHSDGSWESAYYWGQFVQPPEPPDHGAFAEQYEGAGRLESVVLYGVGFGLFIPVFLDVYVWSDDGAGHPGSVICVRTNVNIPEPGIWPGADRADVVMENCCVEGAWWVGFWVTPETMKGAYAVAADLNGSNLGTPMTKVPPGLQWPEGWQDVDKVWSEGVHSLGIGAVLEPCEPVAVEPGSWGKVKALYNSPGR